MLVFKGKETIPGVETKIATVSPTFDVVRTKYFGDSETFEIDGEYGGRPIEFLYLVFDPTLKKYADMVTFLQKLDLQPGSNGKLEQKIYTGPVADFKRNTGNYTTVQTFEDVTYEGHDRVSEILPDIGGFLGGGYFIYLRLRFYQLSLGQQNPLLSTIQKLANSIQNFANG